MALVISADIPPPPHTHVYDDCWEKTCGKDVNIKCEMQRKMHFPSGLFPALLLLTKLYKTGYLIGKNLGLDLISPIKNWLDDEKCAFHTWIGASHECWNNVCISNLLIINFVWYVLNKLLSVDFFIIIAIHPISRRKYDCKWLFFNIHEGLCPFCLPQTLIKRKNGPKQNTIIIKNDYPSFKNPTFFNNPHTLWCLLFVCFLKA